MSPDAHRRALLMLIGCGVLWSTGGVLIKLVAWHPLAIWSVRSAIAAAALYAVRRPSLRGITGSEWGAAAALAATTGGFIVANKLTTAANAILIQYSAPVWVALLGAWLLGERATRLDWFAILAVLAGIALFFVGQLTLSHVAGNLVALGTGVVFALNTLMLRKVALRPELDPLRSIVLGNLIGAVIGAPFCFLSSPPPGATGFAALIALGLVQQAGAYLCYVAAVRHATAVELILIPIIEPILSPLLVALAVGELPGAWALVGGAIVVGAVTARALVTRG